MDRHLLHYLRFLPYKTCLCDVTLSVHPHRAGLKNIPGHVASYSPEYITPTQQI